MNKRAYQAGRLAALTKFGGSSDGGTDGASSYDSSGSPMASVSHADLAQNIEQAFRAFSARASTTTFSDPATVNNSMRGGTPTGGFTTDTTGGLS